MGEIVWRKIIFRREKMRKSYKTPEKENPGPGRGPRKSNGIVLYEARIRIKGEERTPPLTWMRTDAGRKKNERKYSEKTNDRPRRAKNMPEKGSCNKKRPYQGIKRITG